MVVAPHNPQPFCKFTHAQHDTKRETSDSILPISIDSENCMVPIYWEPS